MRNWYLKFCSSLIVLATAFLSVAIPAGPAYAAGLGCDALQTQFNTYGGNYANVTDDLPQYCTASGFLRFAINLILSLIGGITILMLIIGGYRYITSSGNQEQATKGKQTAVWAAIGLAVILMAAALVNIVINLVVYDKLY